MTNQLTLPTPAPEATGVVHIALPDMTLACGPTFLDKPDGDTVRYGHPDNWRAITCDDCRSLGRTYARRVTDRMQTTITITRSAS